MEQELFFSPGDVVHLREDFADIYQRYGNAHNDPLWNGLISWMNAESTTLTITSTYSTMLGDGSSGSQAYHVKENSYFYRGCWLQEWVDAQSFSAPPVDITALLKILEA